MGRLHYLLLRIFGRLPRPLRRFVVHRLAPSFTVGAIAVVERADGSLLLVRHAYRPRWGFPGGLLQRGEDPAAGVRRETQEEVDLDIELVSEPAVVVDPGAKRVDVVYRCRPVSGADPGGVQPVSPEIVEAAWFPLDRLPELQHEAAGALVALARAERGSPRPVLGEGR